MRSFTGRLAAILILLPLPFGSARAEENYYLLSGKTLNCLRLHASDYTPSAGEVIFINVEQCGSPDAISADLMSQVLNSAPDIEIAVADGPDTVVALVEEDFQCFSRLDIPDSDDLLAYYPESCDVAPRN